MGDWSIYDDNSTFYGEDDEYSYVIVDLTGMWEGRINGVRLDFVTDSTDPECAEWDIEYMAYFRSVEEALAYGEKYVTEQGVDLDATDAPTDAPTDGPTDAPTEAPTGDNGGDNGDSTDPEAGTNADGSTNAPSTSADTTATDDTGCASVIGFSAVAILAAATAAVALRKRD